MVAYLQIIFVMSESLNGTTSKKKTKKLSSEEKEKGK